MRRVGTCLSTLVLLFGCAIWPLAAHQLVAPGTVTPFRGGGGGARGPTRWGMVQEFPAGFFVAGSSIRALNGLYDLTRAPPGVSHAFHHAYRNDRSNWLMGYVSAKDEGYPAVGGEATEWVIIDNKWRDRFGHKGDTYLPGAGHMWKHLHRQRHSGPEGFRRGDRVKMRTTVKGYWDGDDVARVTDSRSKDTDLRTIVLEKNNKAFYAPEWRLTKIGVPGYDPLEGDVAADDPRRDDEDELPWQVVAIMSEDRMEELREQLRRHEASVHESIASLHTPLLTAGATAEHGPPPQYSDREGPDVADCAQDRHKTEALDQLGAALGQATDAWHRAVLHRHRGECHRHASEPDPALRDLAAALAAQPLYKDAHFAQGLALLDGGRPLDAIAAFEVLLAIDREWPGLDRWLLRAHARARRRGLGAVSGFRVGERVEMQHDVEGFWEAKDRAVVVGLGTPTGPITIKVERTRRVHYTQAEHLKSVVEGLPRGQTAGGAETPAVPHGDHYNALGAPADFTEAQLKRLYRDMSRRLHPDKGGPKEAFQSVATAYAVLSDDAKRRAWDDGADLPRDDDDPITFEKEIERRYFPDRGGFWAFGDPLEKRRQQKERDEMQRRWREQMETIRRGGRDEL